MIEEDAGCHEDGTADDERLADESRAVTGLGEAAGLGGLRAGEVLRAVCRLLLCGLLRLLTGDLIGKLLLRCDAVGLRLLVGGECRIIAGLEPVHRILLLVQDGLGWRDLGTCLDCGGEKRVEGIIRVRVMAGSDRRTGVDGVQLRQLGVCLHLRLFGGGDQGLGGDGIRLRGIEGGLGVIDGLYCILLALLCLCELRGKIGEDVEVRLCILEIGLGVGKLVDGNAGVGLCGIDGTLGIREGACGGVRLLLGGGEDSRLLGLIGCRRVVDALCGIERLLGVGDVLEELREVRVRIRDALLLGYGVRLGGVQLGLCGRYDRIGGIKGDLLLLDGRLCRIDCRVGGIEVRFRRIKLGLGIRDALLLGCEISLCGIDGTLGIGNALLRGIDICLCGIRCDLLLLDGCGGAGGCLLLGCEIGLGCVECALGVLEAVDIGSQLLLILVDGDGSGIPTRTGPTAVLQRERERSNGCHRCRPHPMTA